jgi:hypothetical protein
MLIIQQYAIKYKMSTIKDFESTELLKIYLTEKQFNACKVDRNEINLNGKLYDIIFSAFKEVSTHSVALKNSDMIFF